MKLLLTLIVNYDCRLIVKFYNNGCLKEVLVIPCCLPPMG